MVSKIVTKSMLKPFIKETIKSLDTMAGLKAEAGDPFEDSVEKFRFKGYAIVAKTYGKLEVVILLHNYVETALAIGNKLRHNMLGEMDELTSVNEDIESALAEWGNTAVGLATNSLEALDLGIKFEPPYFVLDTNSMDAVLKDVDHIVSVPITIEDIGRFYLNLLVIDREAKEESAIIKKSQKILVVDDSSFMRKSITRFLNSLGYNHIVVASNGVEAVELLQAFAQFK